MTKWEYKASAAISAEFQDWDDVLKYTYSLRPAGAPGIQHLHDVDEWRWVLAYCDGFGCVRGVALFDYREDKLLVTVDPSHRRRGIATELMQEAVKRWPIDFEKQGYTEDGAKFFRKFLNSGK